MRKLAKTTEVEQQEHDTEGKDFLFPFNFDIYCFIVITFICDINLVVALAFIDFDPWPFRSSVHICPQNGIGAILCGPPDVIHTVGAQLSHSKTL